MDPLFPLGALASDVKHVYAGDRIRRERERKIGGDGNARELAHVESSFRDADALLTDTQNICLVWDITRGTYAEDIVEKAFECE